MTVEVDASSGRPTEAPVRVGLVGAGPWATMFTAPLLARGPACTLAAVWARRPELAEQLALRHGATAVGSIEELFECCDAIAFAVPPDVQADLAARAARAGRPVLLEKPLGIELVQAERLAAAIAESGVVSQLLLTNRYRASMRTYLDDAAAFEPSGGRATFLGGGGLSGNPFATPWRLEQGGLLDVGPHVLDALDASLGTIVEVRAVGDPLGLIGITCLHDGGAFSQATMSITTPVEPGGLVVELFGRRGRLVLDTAALDVSDGSQDIRSAMAAVAAEFGACVRSGVAHALDAQHGLRLQRLVDDATRQLNR